MKNLTLIDADSIVYIVAYNFRDKKVKKMVEMYTSKFITDILINSKSTHYIGFFGAKDSTKPNFRYAIDPKYKANRPPTPDFITKWGPTILDVFKDRWGFIPVTGMEADDAVAICHKAYYDEFDKITIATVDKDLRQIPNSYFYDIKKHTQEFVDTFTASKNLGAQLLSGDSTDNIPGLPGIGKVKALKALEDCTTDLQVKWKVLRTYYNYENDLKVKETLRILAETKAFIEATPINDDNFPLEYKVLTGARLDRKIRINSLKQVEANICTVIPGGWKSYYKQQSALLTMLVDANDDFILPKYLVNPLGNLDDNIKSEELDLVTMDQTMSNINDFLTI